MDGAAIGLAQAVAMRRISRSGATITLALLLGVSTLHARWLLISIPAIAGAAIMETARWARSLDLLPALIGFVVAASADTSRCAGSSPSFRRVGLRSPPTVRSSAPWPSGCRQSLATASWAPQAADNTRLKRACALPVLALFHPHHEELRLWLFGAELGDDHGQVAFPGGHLLGRTLKRLRCESARKRSGSHRTPSSSSAGSTTSKASLARSCHLSSASCSRRSSLSPINERSLGCSPSLGRT